MEKRRLKGQITSEQSFISSEPSLPPPPTFPRRGCIPGVKRGPYKRRDEKNKINKSCLNDIIPDRFDDEISDTFFDDEIEKNLENDLNLFAKS